MSRSARRQHDVRVLIDECLPIQVRHLLPGHETVTVEYLGWKGLKNGALLDAAEQGGFGVLVTSDVALLREQNLTRRKIGVVVLRSNKLKQLRVMAAAISEAVRTVMPGVPIVLVPPQP